MDNQLNDQWDSRLGYILASIGMAVGTGNIWRFPRMVAEHGGGSFLVGWALFLFIWAFPLIAVEMVIGRKTRKGTIASFAEFVGERYTWMGAFICCVCLFIMFYYSVVVGWTLKYFTLAVTNSFQPGVDTNQLWISFSGDSRQTIFFHFLALFIASSIVMRGVKKGIERVSKLLLPALFILLIAAAIRALTLDGALDGVIYMFTPRLEYLTRAETWLQALTQSAWSTGAGWGLYATYAIYAHSREDITQNALTAGFGNNSVELLAGLTIIPAIFALAPSAHYMEEALSSGNLGITFIYMAELFSIMPGGYGMALVFFSALAIAAISPLVAMLEFACRNLVDGGVSRHTALAAVVLVTFLLGLPSAWSMQVFLNQDWVWGLGLLFSCLFYAIAATRYGVEKMRATINEVSDLRINRVWSIAISYCIPGIFGIFMIWYLYQAIAEYPHSWWDPRELLGFGTVVLQLGLALLVSYRLNPFLIKHYARRSPEASVDQVARALKG